MVDYASTPIPKALSSDSESLEVREDWIPIKGHQQMVEMLRVADRPFRESLLKKLSARNQKLAASLRAAL